MLLLIIIASLSTPFLFRAHRDVISHELIVIKQADQSKQETALRSLFAVTGGDQAVARSLAGYYAHNNQHIKAAQTYERAHGALLIEAAQEYSLALDYANVARVARAATNKKPTADSLAWQGIAFLNQKDAEKGCEKAREAKDKDATTILTKQVVTGCEYMRNNESDPWKLIDAQLLSIAKDTISTTTQPTSSALLLLTRLQQQQGDSEAAIRSLDRAFEQSPYERGVLSDILLLCGQDAAPAQCATLKVSAKHNLDLLPPS